MPYSHAAHLVAPSYGRGTPRRGVWRPHRCPTATRHISSRLPTAAAHPVAVSGGHTDALQPRGTSRRAFLRPRHTPSRCLEATPMPYSHAAHLVAPSYGRGTPRRGVWRGHRCPTGTRHISSRLPTAAAPPVAVSGASGGDTDA